VIRGPVRAVWNSGDFKLIYLSSRAWISGLNPYDPHVVAAIWHEVGGPAANALSISEAHALYPPTTYAFLSPIALLPWNWARSIWCPLNIAVLLLLCAFLHRLAEIDWLGPRSLALIAILLALEPASTAVMLGQTSIIVACLAAISVLCFANRRDAIGGS